MTHPIQEIVPEISHEDLNSMMSDFSMRTFDADL